MSSTGAVTVHPASRVRGRVRPPGDKSISHRYALLAAIADGASTIYGYSTGADCASTLSCLRALGISIEEAGRDPATGLTITVEGRGLGGLRAPASVLDCGNSGSTMRMLAGVLAGHPFSATLDGDASLRRRPMRRIMAPLSRMGARLTAADDRPPLTVAGSATLSPLAFVSEVASAQVKSAVLLAGLHAPGTTSVTEPLPTRDHTERAFEAFGVRVSTAGTTVSVEGGQRLRGRMLDVPGDISSAAFWLAAGAAMPDSEVTVDHVGLNPTRSGILDILRRAGARVDVTVGHAQAGEPIGAVTVRHGDLRPFEVTPAEVPIVIDELPVLAALATHGGGMRVSGAAELRVKESDRITALADGLRAMGGDIDEMPDGFVVRGGRRLRGGVVDARHDHRLAMAFAIAAIGASGPTTIEDAGAAAVSYPEFFTVLETIRA